MKKRDTTRERAVIVGDYQARKYPVNVKNLSARQALRTVSFLSFPEEQIGFEPIYTKFMKYP